MRCLYTPSLKIWQQSVQTPVQFHMPYMSTTLEGNSLRVKTPTYYEISPCKAAHAYNPRILEPGTIRQIQASFSYMQSYLTGS